MRIKKGIHKDNTVLIFVVDTFFYQDLKLKKKCLLFHRLFAPGLPVKLIKFRSFHYYISQTHSGGRGEYSLAYTQQRGGLILEGSSYYVPHV